MKKNSWAEPFWDSSWGDRGFGRSPGRGGVRHKVPVPFLNKGRARGADQDAAEAQKQGLGPELATAWQVGRQAACASRFGCRG